MTLNEIIEKAEFITEEEYDGTDWKQLAETVLADLTQYAKVLGTAEGLDVSAEGVVDLSSVDNIHEVVAVYYKPVGATKYRKLRRLSSHDMYSEGWKMDSGDVIIQADNLHTDDEARVDYYEQLYLAEDGNDYTLNLPEKYHEVVLRGLCSAVFQKEEHMDLKADMQAEYLAYYNAREQMKVERIYEMEPWNRAGLRVPKMTGQLGTGG